MEIFLLPDVASIRGSAQIWNIPLDYFIAGDGFDIKTFGARKLPRLFIRPSSSSSLQSGGPICRSQWTCKCLRHESAFLQILIILALHTAAFQLIRFVHEKLMLGKTGGPFYKRMFHVKNTTCFLLVHLGLEKSIVVIFKYLSTGRQLLV